MRAAGPHAELFSQLWWFSVVVATLVVLGVAAVIALALLRRDRGEPPDDRRLSRWVGLATAATVLALLIFLLADVWTVRRMQVAAGGNEPLTITIRGHQWWWDIEYHDSVPARRLRTANELHVPVGRPLRIRTASADVIHSLWIPQLGGKRDLIPAMATELHLRADRAGVYEAQCAEFCGLQHARMRITVVAHDPDSFNAWYASQLQPASPPADALAQRGAEVFLTRSCVLCHTVRGTLAGGRTGPDLTHLASRRTLAAGTIPNTRGHLAGWIIDPQRIKPGVRMPPSDLSGEELQAILAFLEGLR